MDAKLTLNIDKDIARKAKVYAKGKGRSLSDLVENYLNLLTKNATIDESEFTARVKSLLGCISLPDDFDYKKEVADALANKYLK
jgi:uncharacterized protein (DUF3820 family)